MCELIPMNPPPRTPPVSIPEVLPPEPDEPPKPPPDPGPSTKTAFHPGSALVLVVADNLWNLPEFALPALLFVTVPLSFLSVFISVFLIQRQRNGDRRRSALWKALLLGVLAAIPTSITGTPVGLALLAWAGIKHPWRR